MSCPAIRECPPVSTAFRALIPGRNEKGGESRNLPRRSGRRSKGAFQWILMPPSFPAAARGVGPPCPLFPATGERGVEVCFCQHDGAATGDGERGYAGHPEARDGEPAADGGGGGHAATASNNVPDFAFRPSMLRRACAK